MGQKSGPEKEPAEQVIKQIRRATRRQFSAEEKNRIVLEGLRGEDSIAELCAQVPMLDSRLAKQNVPKRLVQSSFSDCRKASLDADKVAGRRFMSVASLAGFRRETLPPYGAAEPALFPW